MDLSQKIKNRRLELGLTLEQVGDRVGVGKSTVRKWETGDIANMRRDKIELIANALGVSPAYLMGWEEKKDDPVKRLSVKLKKLDADDLAKTETFVDFILADPKYQEKEKEA